MVAKICEDDECGSFSRRNGLWEREVAAYRLLKGRKASFRLPELLLEKYPTIVLEDLQPMRTWRRYEGLPLSVAVSAARAAAQLHVLHWCQPESASPLPPLSHLLTRNIEQFRVSLPAFLDAYGRNLSFDVRKVLHRMSAEGHAPGTSNDTASASLLHGDFRAENVGLKGDQVCVFDFGLAGIGPAVFDIAHLLGGSLTTPVRRRQERQLVQIYCDELRRHSVDYGFEDAWSDYRRVMPMTLPLNVIFGTSTSGSAAQVRSRRRVARRYLLAIADLLNP